MPVIYIIDSIKIVLDFDDHNPPHFHAIYNEYEEVIEILTNNTLEGKLPTKQYKKVIAWAKENSDLLIAKWKELNI